MAVADPLTDIKQTENWQLYSTLLVSQHDRDNLGRERALSHGYTVIEGAIEPTSDDPWQYIPTSSSMSQLLCQARKLLRKLLSMSFDCKVKLVQAPSEIECGCPHTFADRDGAVAYIVIPKNPNGKSLSLRTMVHECIHVYQKVTGMTNEEYLNDTTVNSLLNKRMRFNPDDIPIEYTNERTTDMLNTKYEESSAPLEHMAYQLADFIICVPSSTTGCQIDGNRHINLML